jgi:ABC-type Na+ efflux pump permease subunit
MEEKSDEVVFQTAEEAFQKLADLTGKKIMVPDKADPTVAEEEKAQKEESVVSGEFDELSKDIESRGQKYLDIAKQLQTMDKDVGDLGTSLKS